MRVTRRRLVLLALAAVLLVVACLAAACDSRPVVSRPPQVTPDHIERAKRILASNDPRRVKAGAVRTVDITAEDADLALNYLVHRYANGSAEGRFERGRLAVTTSIPVAALTGTTYLNVELTLADGIALPRIEDCRVGRLPVPAWLAQIVIDRAVASRVSADDLAVLRRAIEKVEFAPSGLRLTYRLDAELVDTVRAALIPAEARERLRVYQQVLAEVTPGLPPGPVSLARLLGAVFSVARARGATSDAVLENRAAIFVLALYVEGRSPADIVPESRNWPAAARRLVTLTGRGDLPRHFIISAALSANTGGPFADAVGIYKEVADSRGGSGFSFVDLAADRAGSRLGELAETRATARALQQRLDVPLTEDMIMPTTRDLQESMPKAEFTRRFGGIGAPAYARMMAEIERRIAAMPVYR